MSRISEFLEERDSLRSAARDARRSTIDIGKPAGKTGAKLGATKKVGTIRDDGKQRSCEKEDVPFRGQEGEI